MDQKGQILTLLIFELSKFLGGTVNKKGYLWRGIF